MNYQTGDKSIVQDFAKRTLANLRFVEAHKNEADVFEVTQLINSLLGLLVFPKEEFWNQIREIPLSQIPTARYIDQRQNACPDLKQLIRFIRNSVSHFNIALKPRGDYIYQIELWNENHDKRNWSAETNIFKLREFGSLP